MVTDPGYTPPFHSLIRTPLLLSIFFERAAASPHFPCPPDSYATVMVMAYDPWRGWRHLEWEYFRVQQWRWRMSEVSRETLVAKSLIMKQWWLPWATSGLPDICINGLVGHSLGITHLLTTLIFRIILFLHLSLALRLFVYKWYQLSL